MLKFLFNKTAQIQNLNRKIRFLEADKKDAEAAHNETVEKLREQHKLELSQKQAVIDDLKIEMSAMRSAANCLKREMECLQDMLEMDLVDENKRLQNENLQLKKHNATLTRRNDQLAKMYKNEWLANKPANKKKTTTTKENANRRNDTGNGARKSIGSIRGSSLGRENTGRGSEYGREKSGE
jgi:hypothetical protein